MDSKSPEQIDRPATFGIVGKDSTTYMTDPSTGEPNTINSVHRADALATASQPPETTIPTGKKVQAGILAGLVAGALAFFRGPSNTPSNPNIVQPPQPDHQPDQPGVASPGAAQVDLNTGTITPNSTKPTLPEEQLSYPLDTVGTWNPNMDDKSGQQKRSDAEALKAMGVRPDNPKGS